MVENGGRTPHGVRGLKSQQFSGGRRTGDGRTPHGVRGLKCFLHDPGAKRRYCRTPHGVRGLKFDLRAAPRILCVVAPLTGCVD